MSKDRLKMLSQTVKKIPLFGGLSPSQINAVLNVCQLKQFEPDTVICASGTPASEMYILLSGELAVLTQDGTRVATLQPVTTVGELGVLTNQQRKATVATVASCSMLKITKTGFEAMLQANLAVQARIFRNIMEILADKIVGDNVRMRDHLREQVQHEERVREHRRRAELAVNIAAQMGVNREELSSRIDERMLQEQRMRILIVDDEEEVAQVMGRILDHHDTCAATSGEQALKLLDESPADLVITDIVMPDMDGFQLLHEVRARFPAMPVLAMSGQVEGDDVQDRGFDAFIEKPMEPHGIRELVEQVVDKTD